MNPINSGICTKRKWRITWCKWSFKDTGGTYLIEWGERNEWGSGGFLSQNKTLERRHPLKVTQLEIDTIQCPHKQQQTPTHLDSCSRRSRTWDPTLHVQIFLNIQTTFSMFNHDLRVFLYWFRICKQQKYRCTWTPAWKVEMIYFAGDLRKGCWSFLKLSSERLAFRRFWGLLHWFRGIFS